MLARFEQRAYAARGEGKALTSDRLAGIWVEENERYYGDSIALPDGYRFGWSYIPHFIDVRFYTYAYAFAHLVAFTLVRRHREEADSFGPAYLELLASAARARRRTCSSRSASISATPPPGRTRSPSSST